MIKGERVVLKKTRMGDKRSEREREKRDRHTHTHTDKQSYRSAEWP